MTRLAVVLCASAAAGAPPIGCADGPAMATSDPAIGARGPVRR